ncbi:major facilitator superfamily domain-containing protein [Phakopsora pachyrhizi]|uniref:Major facilitator superfamily domain-containing protein n=1 Tax=Phakopsora pachyrhizi TaxID=170000 RepID=A0AAV0BWH5_PHAPC|nr:major facilitator superfamily domain-containing protein [Phakopsora pachyrhizi]
MSNVQAKPRDLEETNNFSVEEFGTETDQEKLDQLYSSDLLAEAVENDKHQTGEGKHTVVESLENNSKKKHFSGLSDRSCFSKWLCTIIILLTIYAQYIFSSVSTVYFKQIEDKTPSLFPYPTTLESAGLCISVYNLGVAIGSIFIPPISENIGRVPVIRISGFLFILLNTSCGFSRNQLQLAILRFFSGVSIAASVSLAPCMLHEIWGSKDRGKPLCLNSIAITVGPGLGNVLGQLLLDHVGWRWTFWCSSLIFLLIQFLVLLIVPETYPPRLNPKKDNSIEPCSNVLSPHGHSTPENLDNSFPKDSSSAKAEEKQRVTFDLDNSPQNKPTSSWICKIIPRPLAIIFFDPLVLMLSLQMGMIYILYYMVQSYAPQVYQSNFNQSPLLSSAHQCWIAFGSICASKLSTRHLSAICDRVGIKLRSPLMIKRPEYKFRCMIPGIIFLPLGTSILGFGTYHPNFWIISDVGLFFIGAGLILSFRKASSYVLDTFGLHSASALAAINLTRRLSSFFVPLAVALVRSSFEFQSAILCGTIISLVLVCPMPIVFFLKGNNLRRMPIQKLL